MCIRDRCGLMPFVKGCLAMSDSSACILFSDRERRVVLYFFKLNELQAGSFQPMNKKVRDPFHHRVAKGLVELAILAQARCEEGDRVGILDLSLIHISEPTRL